MYKFRTLVDQVNLTDATQKKHLYIMGLLPMYTPLVYAQNANDFDGTVVWPWLSILSRSGTVRSDIFIGTDGGYLTKESR